MKILLNILSTIAILFVLIIPSFANAKVEQCIGSSKLTIADQSLIVEVASDERTRRYGLMFRKHLGENCGMLFVFGNDRQRTFTMRNTLIPLDIAFISGDGTIKEILTMQPGVDRYPSSVKAVYALEVNAGWFKNNNLQVGQRITAEINGTANPLSGITDQ